MEYQATAIAIMNMIKLKETKTLRGLYTRETMKIAVPANLM